MKLNNTKKYTRVLAILLCAAVLASMSVMGASAAGEQTSATGKITYKEEYYSANKEVCDFVAEELSLRKTEIDISKFKLDPYVALEMVDAIVKIHPELFYVDVNNCRVWTNGTYATEFEIGYFGDSATIDSMQAQFDERVDYILGKIDPSMSDFEKAVILHDEIALNCTYYTDVASNLFGYTSYNALVGGVAICQGYSLAYSYLLSLVGIDSEYVESDSMNHAWNKICIDGDYYNVDLTWDDPVPEQSGHVGHDYFLLSDTEFTTSDTINKHSGYESTHPADNTRFDSALMHSFDTRFCYTDNGCYVICNDTSEYGKSLLLYNDITDTAEVVQSFDYKWFTSSDKTYYWTNGYSSLDMYGDYLYYNSADSLYSYNLTTGESQALNVDLSTYTAKDCYGLVVQNDRLYFCAKETPNDETSEQYEVGRFANVEGATRLVLYGDETFLMGDVNLDGEINVKDATAVQEYIVELRELSGDAKIAADFNEDGIINIRDATAIQMYIVTH